MNMDNVYGNNVAYNQTPKCMTFQHVLTLAEEKTYNYIVDMVRYNKAEKRVDTPYYIGRQGEIATYLGYCRETINRAIQSLINWGLISAEKIYNGGVLRYVVNDITESRLWKYIQPSRRYPLNNTNTNTDNDTTTKKTIELTEDQQKLRAYVNFKLTRNQVKILWQTAEDNIFINNNDIYNTIIHIYDTIQNKYQITNLHGYLKKCLKNYHVTNDTTDNNSNNCNCKKAEPTIIRTFDDRFNISNTDNNIRRSKDTHILCTGTCNVNIADNKSSNDNDDDTFLAQVKSIYLKIQYDFPKELSLLSYNQVKNICQVAKNKYIDNGQYDDLYQVVINGIYSKILYNLLNGNTHLPTNQAQLYLFILKCTHNFNNKTDKPIDDDNSNDYATEDKPSYNLDAYIEELHKWY